MHEQMYKELEAKFPDLDRTIGSWWPDSPWSVWSAFVFEIYGRSQEVDFDVGESCACYCCAVRSREPHIAREYPPGTRLHFGVGCETHDFIDLRCKQCREENELLARPE